MAFVIGKTTNFNVALSEVLDHVRRQERVVVINNNATSPLVRQQNTAGPSVAGFSNYFIGQYTSNLEIRSGTFSNLPALAVFSTSNIVFDPSTTFRSNVMVQRALEASSAVFSSSLLASSVIASNVVIRDTRTNALATSEVFTIDFGPSEPVLSLTHDRGIFMPEGRLGIGARAAEQLHIRDNAIVEGTVYTSNLFTSRITGSNTDNSNAIYFLPQSNVIVGNTTIEGELLIDGPFRTTSYHEYRDFRVTCNLKAMRFHVSNLQAPEYPSIWVEHIVPGYTLSNAQGVSDVLCNVMPIIEIDVDMPTIETTYRALTMDAYGRVGMGTTEPEYFLSLDVSPYNEPFLGKGLFQARSALDATCTDVFVVDSNAHVGIGTAIPEHYLHLDVCHRDTHDAAVFGIHKLDCHTCPFFEFTSNEKIVSLVDQYGSLYLGANASNQVNAKLARVNEPDALVQCATSHDLFVGSNLYASGIIGLGSNSLSSRIIDTRRSFLSNISIADITQAQVSNLDVNVINANLVNAQSFSSPGIVASPTLFTSAAETFFFSGRTAVFSSNLSDISDASSIYTDGKVKIVAPYTDFANITSTNDVIILNVKGPSPTLLVKNTRTADNFGFTSSARLTFAYDDNPELPSQAGLRFTGAAAGTSTAGFLTITNGNPNQAIIMTHPTRVTHYDGTMNVLNFNNAANQPVRVSYFNLNRTILATESTPLSEFQSRLTITNGVQVNGDIYIEDAPQFSVPNKLTVRGTAEITGDVVMSNVNVLGTLSARNSIMQWSDSNLKWDIEPVQDALAKIKLMQGHTFRMAGQEQRSLGLIAQEVAKVMPEVVSRGPDDFLSIAYGNLAGLFVEALKEMTGRIEALESALAQSRA